MRVDNATPYAPARLLAVWKYNTSAIVSTASSLLTDGT